MLLPVLDPYVAILDVVMPGMNGFEAARRLIGASPRLRAIVVSASADVQYDALARAAGAMAFLPKRDLTADAVLALLGSA